MDEEHQAEAEEHQADETMDDRRLHEEGLQEERLEPEEEQQAEAELACNQRPGRPQRSERRYDPRQRQAEERATGG